MIQCVTKMEILLLNSEEDKERKTFWRDNLSFFCGIYCMKSTCGCNFGSRAPV